MERIAREEGNIGEAERQKYTKREEKKETDKKSRERGEDTVE